MSKRYSFYAILIVGWLFVIMGAANTITSIKNISSPFDDLSSEGEVIPPVAAGFTPYLEPVGEISNDEVLSDNWGMASITESISESSLDNERLRDLIGDQLDFNVSSDIQKEDQEEEITLDIPVRMVIDSIALDAPVIPVAYKEIEYLNNNYQQWLAPDEYASGWHTTSAPLGEHGNTVLNGHHNIYGEVFRNLRDVKSGDYISVFSQTKQFTYVVSNTLLLEERFQSVETRMDNARWIQRTHDERLTLITCWPYESNTHRVVVVAIPVEVVDIGEMIQRKAD